MSAKVWQDNAGRFWETIGARWQGIRGAHSPQAGNVMLGSAISHRVRAAGNVHKRAHLIVWHRRSHGRNEEPSLTCPGKSGPG